MQSLQRLDALMMQECWRSHHFLTRFLTLFFRMGGCGGLFVWGILNRVHGRAIPDCNLNLSDYGDIALYTTVHRTFPRFSWLVSATMKIREMHNIAISTRRSAVRGLFRRTHMECWRGGGISYIRKPHPNQRIFVTSWWCALHYITCVLWKRTRVSRIGSWKFSNLILYRAP